MESIINWVFYDGTSPSGLRWKRTTKYSKFKINDVAGTIDKSDGYWKISIQGVRYKVHRVVWYLNFGSLNGMCIDHVNRNRADNNIQNLRLVTPTENAHNRSKNSNNTTGETGINCCEGRTRKGTPYTKFVAHVYLHDWKKKQASFSVQKYGYEEAFRLACEWRQKMILELNAQGAGYTENHGKDSK